MRISDWSSDVCSSDLIVTGLISPDYGWVTLDGHDITDMPMYRRARLGIGYLPQEASIFRGLTVEQNIRGVLEVTEPVRETREAMLESRSEEHTSELQSLMRRSYAVFCLKKKQQTLNSTR